MTKSLEQAFRAASRLPDAEQDELAAAILAEIEAEERFDAALSASHEVLEQLADEAIAEHRGGRTEPIDPKRR
jgi:hypothetical protein